MTARMIIVSEWHYGRAWTGHKIEDECECIQAPCGLVEGFRVIPDRTPRNKAHESLAQAKKAIVFRARASHGLSTTCIIYKWVDDKGWETLHEFPAGTRKEDLPWQQKPES